MFMIVPEQSVTLKHSEQSISYSSLLFDLSDSSCKNLFWLPQGN
jgi:hypothetical protein